MGDVDAPKTDNVDNNPTCEKPKASIDILKGVKPSEDIPSAVGGKEIEKNKPQNEEEPKEKSPVNIETVYKNAEPTDSSTEKIPKESEQAPENSEVKSDLVQSTEKNPSTLKNRSDIFSLNDANNNNQVAATIFSVTGAPSRKPQQQMAPTNSNANPVEPASSTETVTTQMSETSRTSYRNPVTGIGVNSNDEFRSRPHNRKDGNPLLGVGYKEPHTHPGNSKRIPPGGYSNGLW